MKLLVVDECCFTRVGIDNYFTDNVFAQVKCCHSLEQATPLLDHYRPSHILVNLTKHCRHSEDDAQLQAFIEATSSALLFIYLDTPYPYSETPMRIADHAFLFNKATLPVTLRMMREKPVSLMDCSVEHSLFSPQETDGDEALDGRNAQLPHREKAANQLSYGLCSQASYHRKNQRPQSAGVLFAV